MVFDNLKDGFTWIDWGNGFSNCDSATLSQCYSCSNASAGFQQSDASEDLCPQLIMTLLVTCLLQTCPPHLHPHLHQDQDAKPEPDTRNGLSTVKLDAVLAHIQTNLDQRINLSDLAAIAGMSSHYFCRLFKQSMGVTPYHYILQQRVERAKQLLKQQDLSIADIALQCGFANQSHMTRHFHQQTGMTPKVYRQ